MNRFLSFILWTSLSLLISTQGVVAQQAKMEYTPVRTQEYSNLSTFPSACFENVWLDSTGRLLIMACLPEASDGMHLFSFDGYEFRVIRGVLDSLPNDAQILIRTGEYSFAGRAGENLVFHVNLMTGEIRTLEVPEGPVGIQLHAISNDTVRIARYTGTSIVLITWTQNETTSIHIEYPAAIRHLPKTYWMDHTHLWYTDVHDEVVRRIDIHTQQSTEYSFSSSLSQITRQSIMHFRPYIAGNTHFLKVHKPNIAYLFKIDEDKEEVTPFTSLPSNVEDCGVFQDEVGNTLVYYKGTDTPVKAVIHPLDGEEFYVNLNLGAHENANVISIVGEDFNSSLLVCHSRGLSHVQINNQQAIRQALKGHQIRGMIETDDDQIFITTQNGAFFILNLNDLKDTLSRDEKCYLGKKKLFSLSDHLYAGTSYDGLVAINASTGECNTLVEGIGGLYLANRYDSIVAMINNDHELYLYDIAKNTVTPVSKDARPLLIHGRLHDMIYVNDRLWIASSNGLWKIDPKSGHTEILGKEEPFTDYHFLTILAARDGRLWLGTSLGGVQVFNPKDGTVEVLDSRKGLPSNTVVSIQEDKDGDFWVATYDGVALIHPQGRILKVFDQQDGLAGNEANRYAGLTTRSGFVLIGSTDGLSIIDPGKIKKSVGRQKPPLIYLTDVEYRNPDGTIERIERYNQLDKLKEISLPADNRSVKLRFALSSFSSASQNTYQWKYAESSTWKTIANDHTLTLEDIPSGTHQVVIRGYDAEGTLSSNEISLTMIVKRFFFQEWWFYALCGLFIAGLTVTWIVRLRHAVLRATETISKDKQIIEQQAEQLQALNEAKSKYFTEISHEFRTPLTIISGMAAQIIEDPVKWSAKGGTLIRNNSQRLLKLVNQILDLRKLETSEIPYSMVQGNMVAYLSYLADTFKVYTQTRSIDFSFIPFEDQILMDYDPDWIADIVTNLVSNAIKFCEAGDQVKLEVQSKTTHESAFCVIRVADTGAGIAEEHLPHIFEKFYRASTSHSKVEGSGVGLALVYELVQKLHGKVWVESTIGEGSTFYVELPISLTSAITHDLSGAIEDIAYPESEDLVNEAKQESDIHVLIVEDNPDLVAYMQSILSEHYTLHIAQDGLTGQSMAFELVPDMVISDVMMPGQSGIELCAHLKSDRRTDHIPVILLTARVDKETRIESLQKRADAFLTKPFDREELLMIISNLLEQRHQMQLRYMRNSAEGVDAAANQPVDAFVTELQNAIDARLSDEDFSVVHLCRDMSMSRTNLHNKIKALTGRSTTGYIRYRRLLRARQLLKEGNLNVSEVAYAVGFSSQSYFSTSYAKEFGTPPSEFTS